MTDFYDTGDGDEIACGTDAANFIDGGEGDDTIFGGGGNDTLRGGEDRDTLHGEEGDDTLEGGDDRDELNGGPGNDTLIGGEGDDTLNGGEGDDTASYAGATAAVMITIGDAEVDDGEGDEDTLRSIENLIGSANDDTLTGNDGDNVIDGGGISGTGEALDGAGGTDTLSYRSQTGPVEASVDGGVTDQTVSNFENLTGTMMADDDVLTGDAGANVLDGLSGSNTLRGDPEDATTTGNDTFVVWQRDGGADIISDFEVRDAEGNPRDVIKLRGFSSDATAAIPSAADGGTAITVTDGTETQTITLTGVEDRAIVSAIVGADGRGSALLIFADY